MLKLRERALNRAVLLPPPHKAARRLAQPVYRLHDHPPGYVYRPRGQHCGQRDEQNDDAQEKLLLHPGYVVHGHVHVHIPVHHAVVVLYRHDCRQQPAEFIVRDDDGDVVPSEKVCLVVQKIAGVELLKIAELERLVARVGVVDVVKALFRRLCHHGVDKLVVALDLAQQRQRPLVLRVLFPGLKISVNGPWVDDIRHRAGEVCGRVGQLLAQVLLIRRVAERDRRAPDDERNERYHDGHLCAQ